MSWFRKKGGDGDALMRNELRKAQEQVNSNDSGAPGGKAYNLRRLRIPIIIILLLSIGGGIYLSSINRSNSDALDTSMLAPEVDILVVREGVLEHRIEAPGSVSYLEKASVASKVMGRVQSLYADQGDLIKQGQRLAQMETLELDLRLKSSQSSLNSAMAQLDLSRARYRTARMNADRQIQDLERMQSDIIEKKAGYILARRNLSNKQEIYRLGGVSRSELKSVYSGYLSASSQYYQARKNYQMKTVGFRDEDLRKAGMEVPLDAIRKREKFIDFNTLVDRQNITVADAAVKNAHLELESTQMMLRESTILSPLSGVVAARAIEVGEEVKQGEPLFTIVRLDRLLVTTSVPEEDVAFLELGQKAYFTVDARNGLKREGTVYQISPIVDVSTRSAEIKIDAENKEILMNPGMFVRCAIVVRRKEQALGIPANYLLEIKESDTKRTAKVFVLTDGLALQKEVALGESYGDLYEIISGLKPGDQVIASNLQTLKDGIKVRVRKKIQLDAQESDMADTPAMEESVPSEDQNLEQSRREENDVP